jgi:TadE-like protein
MTTTMPTRTGRARARGGAARDTRSRGLGQSLAEFALTFPMVMLMVLFGLDFGRVFLGWVALNSAAREAANYAAMNPDAWTLPYNLAVQAEYNRLVTTETSGMNCTLVSPIPDPTFASGTSIGAPAQVRLTCSFNLITPFIGMLVGNPIPVTASSAFPVRAGLIEGIPTPAPSPTATPTPAPTPTPTPGPTAAPTPTPTPTPAPTPTPTPSPTPATCTVVSLLNLQTNKAQSTWTNAGFSGQVIFSPLVPPNYRIEWQSLTVGASAACSSGITVRSNAP